MKKRKDNDMNDLHRRARLSLGSRILIQYISRHPVVTQDLILVPCLPAILNFVCARFLKSGNLSLQSGFWGKERPWASQYAGWVWADLWAANIQILLWSSLLTLVKRFADSDQQFTKHWSIVASLNVRKSFCWFRYTIHKALINCQSECLMYSGCRFVVVRAPSEEA